MTDAFKQDRVDDLVVEQDRHRAHLVAEHVAARLARAVDHRHRLDDVRRQCRSRQAAFERTEIHTVRLLPTPPAGPPRGLTKEPRSVSRESSRRASRMSAFEPSLETGLDPGRTNALRHVRRSGIQSAPRRFRAPPAGDHPRRIGDDQTPGAASPPRFSSSCLLTIGLSAGDRPLPKPNYDLAARWMATKVGKLVFDTSVAPRWAETSDRFWYAFETAQGRRFMLVDPLKRTKAPLWDNAKMAAMLTNITRIPYESQHLPITPATMKWVKNDTAIRFELEVPKDAKIVGEKEEEKKQEASSKKTRSSRSEDRREEDRRNEDRSEEDGGEEVEERETDRRRKRTSRRTRRRPVRPTRRTPSHRRPRRPSTSSTTSPPASWPSCPTSSPIPRSPGGPRCRPTTRRSSSPAATTSS